MLLRLLRRPIAFHLSTLFGLLILLTALWIGGTGYTRILTLINLHGEKSSESAAREIQLELEAIVGPVELAVGLMRHDRANLANALPIRMASLGVFMEALGGLAPVNALYIGYEDGDFFMVRRLRGEAERQRFQATGDAEFLIQSIDREPTGADGRFLFLDSDGWVIDERPMPDYPDSYDPRQRDWYRVAWENQGVVRTDPYIFRTTGSVGITFASRSSVAAAVVGADLELEALSDIIARQKPTPGSELALTDAADHLIAYERSELVSRRTEEGVETAILAEFPVPALRALALADPARAVMDDRMPQKPSSPPFQRRYERDGQAWLGQALPIPVGSGAPLTLYLAVPEQELLAAAHEIRRNMLITAAIILVLAVAAVSLLARWVSRPVRDLQRLAQAIADLDLTRTPDRASVFVEIQRLQSAMESMRSGLATFIRYVPSDLVRRLIASGKVAEVGGGYQDIAVMFTDVANFTAITEDMSPAVVLRATSRYFEVLTRVIMQSQGTVDKYIGDAVMALWNAPSADPDYLNHACMGALAVHRASEELNVTLEAEGFPALRTRIGLHCGEALVGNVGGTERLQFTALGPVVNLASRIEGLNKKYGTSVLVSEPVRQGAGDAFHFRKVDLVKPAGTTHPLAIYEILGAIGEEAYAVPPARLAWAQAYEAALALYLERRFEQAEAAFARLTEARRGDRSAEVMAARCRDFWLQPPPADWDGSFAFAEK